MAGFCKRNICYLCCLRLQLLSSQRYGDEAPPLGGKPLCSFYRCIWQQLGAFFTILQGQKVAPHWNKRPLGLRPLSPCNEVPSRVSFTTHKA